MRVTVVVIALAFVAGMVGCSQIDKNPVAPQDAGLMLREATPPDPGGEFRIVDATPQMKVMLHKSIIDSLHIDVGVEDSTTASRIQQSQAMASWMDGSRVRYGWDYDRDFYIDYKTPRSCCYRVYMTYALYYALQAAGKPLVVYGLSCNADGTITWRIIIGFTVIQRLSPVSDWFLMWQAKMQYVG